MSHPLHMPDWFLRASLGTDDRGLIERLARGARDWDDLASRCRAEVRTHQQTELVKLDARARRLRIAIAKSLLKQHSSPIPS